jgi:hypothetical protein
MAKILFKYADEKITERKKAVFGYFKIFSEYIRFSKIIKTNFQ